MSILDKITSKKTAPAEKAVAKKAPKKVVVTEATSAEAVKSKRGYAGVLVTPVVTEKSARLAQHNQYMFVVSKRANKITVAQAVEARFGIKPTGVNMINRTGRAVRFGRFTGRQRDQKIAIVSLPKGKTLSIFEGV